MRKYEIVNLRTILIFVGKNYFSETKGGGDLKCLRGFRGGVSQMSMFVYKGERGVKNALNSVYVVCTQSQILNKRLCSPLLWFDSKF